MSGLETVAAVIGISDAALRAISLFYETIDDLKKAPRDIQVLKSEIGGLQECLLQLKRLSTQDEKALSTIKNFGLRDIVDNCAGACETLRTAIQKWSGPGVNDLWSRFQFVLNKKDIEKARDITSNAKQTTILAVVITQLSIQIKGSTTKSDRIANTETVREIVAKMASNSYRNSTRDRNNNNPYRTGSDERNRFSSDHVGISTITQSRANSGNQGNEDYDRYYEYPHHSPATEDRSLMQLPPPRAQQHHEDDQSIQGNDSDEESEQYQLHPYDSYKRGSNVGKPPFEHTAREYSNPPVPSPQSVRPQHNQGLHSHARERNGTLHEQRAVFENQECQYDGATQSNQRDWEDSYEKIPHPLSEESRLHYEDALRHVDAVSKLEMGKGNVNNPDVYAMPGPNNIAGVIMNSDRLAGALNMARVRLIPGADYSKASNNKYGSIM